MGLSTNEGKRANILSAGAHFGQYIVKAYIAGGGIGQVYAATHAVYGNNVALKVLHPDLHRDASWRARLTDEGTIGRALKHPNVLTTREIVEHEGRVALVLDLARGASTLHRVISREYPRGLPTELALRLMLGVLQGVEHAHDQGVIHGDIKPENIMLTDLDRSPAEWSALVTDFGTASLIANPVMIDGTAAVVASPRYASPEHLKGVDALSQSSDIFSLGLLLHYLLTGTHASPATTVPDALVFLRKPLDIAALVDQPRMVMSVFETAVSLDASDRFGSCRDMAMGIRRVIDVLGADFEDDIEADIPTVIMGDATSEESKSVAVTEPPHKPAPAPSKPSRASISSRPAYSVEPMLRPASPPSARTVAPPSPNAQERREWLWMSALAIIAGLVLWSLVG